MAEANRVAAGLLRRLSALIRHDATKKCAAESSTPVSGHRRIVGFGTTRKSGDVRGVILMAK
jgi:hypothetical protein